MAAIIQTFSERLWYNFLIPPSSRSVLEGSDSIFIDPAVISTEDFSCLLDMVYTGKLPPGKHNLNQIIAAATSLQMTDLALDCKNILTSLMKQPSTASTTALIITQLPTQKPQGQEADLLSSRKKVAAHLGKDDVEKGVVVKREMEEMDEGGALEKEEDKDPVSQNAVRKGTSSQLHPSYTGSGWQATCITLSQSLLFNTNFG